jgi:hypothetical protein
MKQSFVVGAIAMLLLGALAASASAEAKYDSFGAIIGPNNTLLSGSGSGWRDPETSQLWFHYPNTEWWNEWFYDDPLDVTRRKKIDWSMWLTYYEPGASHAEVAINWSTPLYPSGTGKPPIPPLDPLQEQSLIHRQVVWTGDLPIGAPMPINDHIDIPDYNPEWVSIDIQGYNFQVSGGILHECVPEPASLAMLLGGGLLGLLIYLRRRWAH